MTRTEAHDAARFLHRCRVENVRIVLWMDDKTYEVMVQRNNVVLSSVSDVASYVARHGLA